MQPDVKDKRQDSDAPGRYVASAGAHHDGPDSLRPASARPRRVGVGSQTQRANMIRIERAQDCVGCSACADICPSKAIALSADSEGFQYPEVNRDLCTNCGLCEETCPQLHPDDLTPGHRVEPIVYAAYHKDQEVRRESTSGGLFSALANEMYDRGGYVGGVVYTPELTARHIVSKNREDLCASVAQSTSKAI